MFHLVLYYLVFIILRAEANFTETENPVIRLSYTYNRNENFTVWKGKPLKIIIENGYARHVWCVNIIYDKEFGYDQFVPPTEFPNNDYNILEVPEVTAGMSTRWGCTVLQEYHGPATPYPYKNRNYTAKDLHFTLHVKGARPVLLTANQHKLTYTTTNLSSIYDGEANYTYENGEDLPMGFSCQKPRDSHPQDTLRLEYYNAKGILLFQTNPQDKVPVIFRSILKSNNDKYYLECIRAVTNFKNEYRYRITFWKREVHDAWQHAVILSVNGQKLTTSLNSDIINDDYVFSYIDGEVLNVTCQKKDVNMQGSLVYHFYEAKVCKSLRSPSGAVISMNISASDIKNKSLICSINNTDVDKPNARLLFLSDVPPHGVRVSGLSRNNILYQYTNDLNQWTIEYQYSVNDTLNLTCVTDVGFQIPRQPERFHDPFLWKLNDEKIPSTAESIPNTQIKFTNTPFSKTLNANHNGSSIKCVYFPETFDKNIIKTVEIILRLKPELVSETKRDEVTSDEKTQRENLEKMIVPIAVGVGVAIAIITIVCLLLWRKRTKRANHIETPYDNLSNYNESPIPPFPTQWEANYEDSNYAKIDEGVMQENYNYSTNDKLYRTPHQRQSNISENHYTEIEDYIKPKPDGLEANWNTAQLTNYNKEMQKATPSHSSYNAYNNFGDAKQCTYDKLWHNNVPINNTNDTYSNVAKPIKSKSVTFRQISNDLSTGRNLSEGSSGRNNYRKITPNNDGRYANTGDIYIPPGDMNKKPDYENHVIQNERAHNPSDQDYAEPYDDIRISCKNNFYG